MTVSLPRRSTRSVPQTAEIDRAWQRYLDEARAAGPERYDRVEERAWRRLQTTLAGLGAPLQRGG